MDNRTLGKNIAKLRGDRPQTWLVDQACQQGLPWYPMTVHRIEHGERPVRLVEAPTLAAILGTTVLDLLGTEQPEVKQLTAEVARLTVQVAAIKDVLS